MLQHFARVRECYIEKVTISTATNYQTVWVLDMYFVPIRKIALNNAMEQLNKTIR